MLDFLRISTRPTKNGVIEIFPKFVVGKSNDLMIRGGDFYAIYNEVTHLWSTDEQDAIDYIDSELMAFAEDYKKKTGVQFVEIMFMWDSDSGIINKWHTYCQKQMRENYKPLDQNILFANTEVQKTDYATHVLPYVMEPGPTDAWDTLISTLYDPGNRHKIEWSIGAIITGASKKLEKFLVLYGDRGTGKSTIIKIITNKLFNGYAAPFNAKMMGSATASFPYEPIKDNPVIAFDNDTDLSRLNDNTRFNSVSGHEKVSVNTKNKSMYYLTFICFLILASNNPVLVTDAKSGILRRMIDANPTGNKIPLDKYKQLKHDIDFELGAIAAHCKEVFEQNPNFYDDYIPIAMMGETNAFFNFVEDYYFVFKNENHISLNEAWQMYKEYADNAKIVNPFSKMQVKSELKAYFVKFEEDHYDEVSEKHIKNYYDGFKYYIFDKDNKKPEVDVTVPKKELPLIVFEDIPSKLDEYCKDCPAQYANTEEKPTKKWENVDTSLKDLDTSKIHYVRPQENLIVIDFDLKDEHGRKDFKLNLEAASKWPKTYAELSKSGSGIHLHYIYDGDVTQLSRIYEENIEIKVFTGNSSLRRKLTKCNNEDIKHISAGLPLKGDIKVENLDIIKNERQLRAMIIRNLNKEYTGATVTSVSFIKKLLDEAYDNGVVYDVSDMYNVVLAFAANSTHQKDNCLKMFDQMKWKSEECSESIISKEDKPIVFFDCEVFPNVNFINYKIQGDPNMIRLINPTPKDIEKLLEYRIVGYNNREYDNHIIYGIYLGRTPEEIYALSKAIIDSKRKDSKIKVGFKEAYNLSYTDVYDYLSVKQTLKKWQIQLHLYHLELGLPWDKPVPQALWKKVSDYCDNDVISLEAVWDHSQADFTARKIIADIAGMTVNDTDNAISTRIIFGKERNPVINYVNLADEFPGYEFIKTWDAKQGKYIKQNMFRGIDLGLGGYVYSEPCIEYLVALLDVESLHPHSAIALNAFGEYTKQYYELLLARLHIKHGDYDKAGELFDGKLKKYLTNKEDAKALSKALKIVINSVYGLSSAAFKNPFKHPLNENNIIALRGALFMKTLQDEVTARGFRVIHIKTDSIKIPNATKEIIDFCMEFAKKYKYTFAHEATYERICLVDKAQYIAKYASPEKCMELYGYVPEENEKHKQELAYDDKGNYIGPWTATGTLFQIPYVFKTLFSKEKIEFDDLCEIKQVKTAMYLDNNEELDTSREKDYYKVLEIRKEMATDPNFKMTKMKEAYLTQYQDMTDDDVKAAIANGHNFVFVGRVGYFCPVKAGSGGGLLVAERNKPDGTVGMDSVVGASGFRWKEVGRDAIPEDIIDKGYHNILVNKAIDAISTFGDFYQFVD